MLKASSLIYAIAIALIIALVSSSLILFAYFNTLQFQTYLEMDKIQQNAISGMNLLLSEQQIVALNEKKIIDLYEDGNDSVFLERKNWGAYEIMVSKAFSKNMEMHQAAQVGSDFNEDNKTALYLSDQDKPLSLCGNTVIKGICFLPKAGIKRAYIEGQSFSGNKLIDGDIKESGKELPPVNKELLEGITSFFLFKPQENDSIVNVEEQETKDTIINSFESNTIYLFSNNAIVLRNKKYSGNMIIASAKSIKIDASSSLEDVIIVSPKIEIDENFKGNIQAFASDSLIVGKKCKLNYPSVMGIVRTTKSADNPFLQFGEEAEIGGVLFAYQENTDNRKQVRIIIEKNAIIKGQVFSSGLVDLKGSIYGSLICNKIMLVTPSSVYENHLLNATIDNTKLSKHFAGINLAKRISAQKVVKWLY